MRAAIDLALARWGRLDGVVHAAGVAGGGVIQRKDPAVAARVMAPKVSGTECSAGCLRGFRSTSSRSARRRRRCAAAAVRWITAPRMRIWMPLPVSTRGEPAYTVAIDWDAWRDIGMAVETGVPDELARHRAAMLKDAITPDEGAEAFARIVAGGSTSQIVVSPLRGGVRAANARARRMRPRPRPPDRTCRSPVTPMSGRISRRPSPHPKRDRRTRLRRVAADVRHGASGD